MKKIGYVSRSFKPVDMQVEHAPASGKWGDCARACVASLLGLEASDVPHFCEDGCSSQIFMDRLFAFLRPHGLYPLVMMVGPSQMEWFDYFRGYFILGGVTHRGTRHYVVASGRAALVHDPHPTDKVGVSPDTEGETKGCYEVMLFVSLNK